MKPRRKYLTYSRIFDAHLAIWSALCVMAFGAVAIDAAQTASISTALCDGIAAQIRGDPEIASGGSKDDLLAPLSKGEHPYVELGSGSDRLVGGDEIIRRIRETLNPSDELVRTLGGFFENVGDVSSLPDSDLHMVETFGGSAGCGVFLFFRSMKGTQ